MYRRLAVHVQVWCTQASENTDVAKRLHKNGATNKMMCTVYLHVITIYKQWAPLGHDQR